jgi:hypothetical protein
MSLLATSTWVAIGATATVVGAGVSAYGMYQSGQAQKAMGKYNADLAKNEAIAKEQQSRFESLQMQKDKERLTAAQRAGFAKGGSMITEGTPLLLMAEQAGTMELDILNNQRNRAMEAQALRSQSKLDLYAGNQAARAANIGAGATVLSGLGSAGMGVASYKAAGSAGSGAPKMKTVSASQGYTMVG